MVYLLAFLWLDFYYYSAYLIWKSALQVFLRLLITMFVVATLSGQNAAASMAACEMHGATSHETSHQMLQSNVQSAEPHHHEMMVEMDCCDPQNTAQCSDCTCPTHMCSTNLAAFSPREWVAPIVPKNDKLSFTSGQLSDYPRSLYKPPILA
ncbi:hypothetical protein FX995_21195 [Pseudoalteromonas flavipulchra]|nr:hypothetical protein QT15_13215 [Pseudoalteromonas flavipulchra NCIMB 2033 = ATCC BAA-314]MBD0784191.1 hypothetical protein [Pseudoalteromonas flavipulchra]MBE0375245.1 hypothetical protein [Pseudoalteromonas flavipulchra NCIMB 2033 = ATCC BAA-314]